MQYVRGQSPASSSAGGGAGIVSINNDITPAQLIVAASTGTDFTVSTSAGTTTLALPSASAAARGLVTTAAQTFAGAKTFSADIGFTNAGNRSISMAAAAAATSGKNISVLGGNSGAGTDLSGGSLNLCTGLGTGNDASPTLNLRLPTTNASGTTVQAYYSALSLVSFDADFGVDTYPSLSLQSANTNKAFNFLLQSQGNDTEINAISFFGDEGTDLTISVINQLTSANIPGGNINLVAGQSTGSAGSSVVLFVSDVSASGTSLNGTQRGLQVDSAPNNTDGPSVTIGTVSKPNSQHKIYTKSTTGANTATLANSPVSGNPHGWIQITINGVASYIPYWQ